MFSELATEILNFILSLENTHLGSQNHIEKNFESSRQHQLAKIKSFIDTEQTIHMILPAFPAKSPNPEKTVSHRPDYGEVLALSRLNRLCAQISETYVPGAKITICSDGRVFSDVVEVCDGAVDVYGRDIKQIITDFNFKYLDTFSLDDVFSSHDYDRMRQRLVLEFAENLDSLRVRVQSEAAAKLMFNGIHRFMFEDQMVLNPTRSKNQNKLHAKNLAFEVIRRSNAWSRLVEKQFPESLRLSIHPQLPSSKKIGIQLLPSGDHWRTPWHSVAVFDGDQFYLSPRAEVESAGGVLTYAQGQYPYYILEQTQKQVAL